MGDIEIRVLLDVRLIWLVSEFLRLCVECSELRLLASLSISLLAASSLASRSISDVGRFSSAGAFTSIFLLLSGGVAVAVSVISI